MYFNYQNNGNLFNSCRMQLLIVAIFGLLSTVAAQNRCTNPNRTPGACRSIYDCPNLIAVLTQAERTESQVRFLQQSQCTNGVGTQPYVCCTPDNDFITQTPPSRRPAQPSNGQGNQLPTPPNCGARSLSDRIYNGNDTAIDDYPWMVLLTYTEKNGQRSLDCGGSLLNSRYVLTAAHCVKGEIETTIGPLTSIRLGEYDTSQEIDCVDTDCNEPVLEVGIEEIIPHPGYFPAEQGRYNDIALVRLNADVRPTNFIKPVCLPLANYRHPINDGDILTVAGWGRTLTVRKSNVKQHLKLAVNNHNECRAKFRSRRIDLIASQICLGGEFAKDSCDGDSGGPLMRLGDGERWFQEGIVSFGNRCGLENWPGVYTRVSDYVDWIQQNMRP